MIRRVDVNVQEPPGFLSTVEVVAIFRIRPESGRRLSGLIGAVRSEVPSRDGCSTVIGGGRL